MELVDIDDWLKAGHEVEPAREMQLWAIAAGARAAKDRRSFDLVFGRHRVRQRVGVDGMLDVIGAAYVRRDLGLPDRRSARIPKFGRRTARCQCRNASQKVEGNNSVATLALMLPESEGVVVSGSSWGQSKVVVWIRNAH